MDPSLNESWHRLMTDGPLPCSRRRSRGGTRWTTPTATSRSPWRRAPPPPGRAPSAAPGCPAARPWSRGAPPSRGRARGSGRWASGPPRPPRRGGGGGGGPGAGGRGGRHAGSAAGAWAESGRARRTASTGGSDSAAACRDCFCSAASSF